MGGLGRESCRCIGLKSTGAKAQGFVRFYGPSKSRALIQSLWRVGSQKSAPGFKSMQKVSEVEAGKYRGLRAGVSLRGTERKPQISPLRCAPVEMTILFEMELGVSRRLPRTLQIPRLRSGGQRGGLWFHERWWLHRRRFSLHWQAHDSFGRDHNSV
jgi:hypothetical protein